jgi:hypothetical protein
MSTPAHKLRYGCLQVVIWRNTSTDGRTYYSATPQRSFRNGDDPWRENDSLNESDLLAMAEPLREAYTWIRMQKRADAAGRKQADRVTAR